MLRKIYRELVQIRKELHAIRSGMKFFSKGLTIDEINLHLGERLMRQGR